MYNKNSSRTMYILQNGGCPFTNGKKCDIMVTINEKSKK